MEARLLDHGEAPAEAPNFSLFHLGFSTALLLPSPRDLDSVTSAASRG